MLVVLAAALAIAAALHWAAQASSLWVDEIASTKFAEEPIGRLWSSWMRRETNPPLYYTVLAGWSAVAGSSDGALRLLSFVCGAAAIPLAYRLAERAAGPRAGAIAALLIAADPAHVLYSQEIRGYALSHTLGLAALLGFVEFLNAPAGRRRFLPGLVAYALSCVAALYVHTTLVLLPLLLNVFFLVFAARNREKKKLIVPWLIANALLGLAWLWWLTITLWQLNRATNLTWLTAPTPMLALDYVQQAYVPEAPMHLRRILIPVLGLAFGFASWRMRRRSFAILPLCAALVPVLLFAISLKSPVMLPRTIYWASGPFIVTVAIGLALLPWRRIGILLTLCLIVGMIGDVLVHRVRTTREPWRAVVTDIAAVDPDARVIAASPPIAFALQRYCIAPVCRFDIHTIRRVDETWTADMPSPGPIELAAVAALATPRFYTVTRGPRNDPSAILRSVAAPEVIPVLGAEERGVEVLQWTNSTSLTEHRKPTLNGSFWDQHQYHCTIGLVQIQPHHLPRKTPPPA